MSIGIIISQIQHQSKQAMFEHLAALKALAKKETGRLPENDRKNDKVLNLPDFSKVHDEEDVLILIDYLNSKDGRINICKNGKITFEPHQIIYEFALDENALNKIDVYA